MSESDSVSNSSKNASPAHSSSSRAEETFEVTEHTDSENDLSLANESIESINKSPQSPQYNPTARMKKAYQVFPSEITGPKKRAWTRKTLKKVNTEINNRNTCRDLGSPLSSLNSSTTQTESEIPVFKVSNSNYNFEQPLGQSLSYSVIKTARELLKYGEDMMTIALPNRVALNDNGQRLDNQSSCTSPSCMSMEAATSSSSALVKSHQESIIQCHNEGLKKLGSIIDLAQTFQQLEKEKIGIKKRKMTLLECYQKQVVELEREKLEIEKEKLEFKRIKLAFLKSENLVPPTKQYWAQSLDSDDP